jgi:ATP/ADP translocase
MSRAARLLGVALRIRPAELPPVGLLGAWCFCLVGAIWLTRAVRDSLFLANLPADRLAYLYVASPLVVTAVGLLYGRVADRFRRERLVATTAALIAGALVAARLALGPDDWIYYVLYAGADVACALAAMQFWTVAGDQFTARDAKRLIGLIAAGGTVANIVIGFGVSGLARRAGAENLLWVCAALFLTCGGLALALARLYGGRLGRGRRRPAGARDPRGLDAPGAGHLRLVVIIVVCAVITLTMIDFQFKSITAAAYGGDRVAMVRFFGILSGITGCVSLVIQLGVTGRLLARAGVAGVLVFLPALLALGATGLLLLPGLVAATFCKATEGTLRYTLNDAGMQLVYVPVPSQVRSRVKAAIDAVARPGTEAAVGLLLLGARAVEIALAPLAGVAVVSSGIWLAAVLALRPAYVRSLRETLHRRRFAPEAVEPPAADPGLAATLADDAAPPRARREAARALGQAATADAGVWLSSALATSDETVRGAVCQALARAHRRNPALVVPRAALHAAIDRELAAAYHGLAAAEGLGRAETAMNPDGTRAAPPFALDDPEGAAALASKALRERTERARDRILHLLDVLRPDQRISELARGLADIDATRRANAVEVLDSILDRRLRRTLVPLVDDTPRFLKLNAVEGLVPLPRKGRDGWVEELLGDDSPWMIACAAYYAGQHRIGALADRLGALARHPDPVVAEAAAAALSEEHEGMTTVEKVLFLKGIDLFTALAGEELADIAKIAELVEKDAGETILVEGEHGDALFFILEGRVAVKKGERLLAELGERDVLGEMALLDPGPRSASAVALSDVTLLSIGRDDFDDIMRERPEVPIGVMKVLVRRLREAIAA